MIHAAVRQIVAGEDPFATHLLIHSADKMLIDLAKHSAAGKPAFDFTALMKPEYKHALVKLFRETYNFLKHADNDHDQTLHVGDIATSNVLQLAACIANYQALFDEVTNHMLIGFAIARLIFPDGFVRDAERPLFDQAMMGFEGYTVREFISGLNKTGVVATAFPNLVAERAEDLQDITSFLDQSLATR
ncbi:hypothetical protein ABIF65_003884 [Bradyrhizobium japonicum]|uniref:Uncharacterized protein n=1 Tax=Bradyrhizobium japonicum TaxID=375 RepID=A0A0A3XKU9_BRAJP|nr:MULTISPECIES: hypothetical protein [Bradyrhizobium]WLC02220.1 hypothetical protein QIH92_24125 [Bradyrhizobium japonicum USDA 123]KGT73889.1 hypothetical protein MA20_40955 [Bradyrhizobium japonicum]MBR0882086.1 hypothetical protein [Bradyrhizobium liaoningense]MBR1002034.1 hypothetical protein [Bradyrhizobium liaoningense]MCP1741737.1 hypothetical protein [Bradyrhizobium japonicum]